MTKAGELPPDMRGSLMPRAAIAPRLLTQKQAAEYCGVSSATFAALCPVTRVALGPGKRLERYDVKALDAWIDRLGRKGEHEGKDWLAELSTLNSAASAG